MKTYKLIFIVVAVVFTASCSTTEPLPEQPAPSATDPTEVPALDSIASPAALPTEVEVPTVSPEPIRPTVTSEPLDYPSPPPQPVVDGYPEPAEPIIGYPGPLEPVADEETRNVLLDLAVQNLTQRLNINSGDIGVLSLESVDWPDGSLGCPTEGAMYITAVTPGYRIILSVSDDTYTYHTDRNRVVVLCGTDGRPIAPTE